MEPFAPMHLVVLISVLLLLVAPFFLVCRRLWRKGSLWSPPSLNW
jgi:hypothetical protein